MPQIRSRGHATAPTQPIPARPSPAAVPLARSSASVARPVQRPTYEAPMSEEEQLQLAAALSLSEYEAAPALTPASANAPPADPRHEGLAQLKAEQAALEKGMRKLLALRKPTEEHNREYCRMKANHAAVLKKQASLCLVCAPPPAPSAPKCLATSATPASPLTPTPPAAFAATAVEGKQAARVEVAASGVSPSGVSPLAALASPQDAQRSWMLLLESKCAQEDTWAPAPKLPRGPPDKPRALAAVPPGTENSRGGNASRARGAKKGRSAANV